MSNNFKIGVFCVDTFSFKGKLKILLIETYCLKYWFCMKNLIERIKKTLPKNIVIIGDVMLDEYVWGSVSRISPEAPVPVLKEEKKEWRLGGAANVALNCKKIGCSVNLVGIINDTDLEGKKIVSLLVENGISTESLIKSNHRRSTCKKRFIASGHQLLRLDKEDNFELAEREFILILEKISRVITPGMTILVSDYAKGVISKELMEKIVVFAQKNDCKILVDPKGKKFDKYFGVNYIKPNYKEYSLMLDAYGLSVKDSIKKNGQLLCGKLGLDGLFITLGERGIHFISTKNDIFVPAVKKDVYDLTGAGDTVLSFLAVGLSLNLSIEDCLLIANKAASIAVSKFKTYAVNLDELFDFNNEQVGKIFNSWQDLKIKLDKLKSQGQTIVFTNGCFDLLHAGHLHLLNEAKKQGDVLVVAINTDESVKRYKGNGRPIKTLSERIKIMAAIGIVDFVVVFEQDTPKELIECLAPDVLVKGGDYDPEKIAGGDFVRANGGKVFIVNFQDDFSTTNIIKRMSV